MKNAHKLTWNPKINYLVRKLSCQDHSCSLKHYGLIEGYTVISNQHMTPEIKLRLITRECKVWNQPVYNDTPHPLGEPFWAFYWPGGQALSRYILDNPMITKGKRILDFGSGSGALSIAALLSGAKLAVANDIDPVAVSASQMNAALNKVKLNINEDNLIGTDCANFDVILVGDMFYDSAFSEILIAWLKKLRLANKTVLVGDPGRGPIVASTDSTSLRKSFYHLAKYELDPISKEDNNGFHQAHVFSLI